MKGRAKGLAVRFAGSLAIKKRSAQARERVRIARLIREERSRQARREGRR